MTENENPEVSEEEPEESVAEAEPEEAASESEEAAPESEEKPSDASGGDELEPATPETVADTAQEFLSGLLETMGFEASIETSVEGNSAFVDITGDSLGVLIGRRGQTLDALQELARTAVQRRLRARVRLLVDVEGYRARRRASLADYAKAIAERAKARGTEIELEPMTAYERKIVHDAVAEVDGASSFSEGEEPARKVVVRGE